MEAFDFFGNYHLDRLKSEPCATRATLVLKKGVECVEAIARVANTLRGSLQFEKGKLSGPLMSTMMMGSDEQMKIETALSEGFKTGFSVHLADYTLTLTTEQNTLVFVRDVCVEMLFGEYMLSAYNGEHVSLDSLKLVLVPSGKGCVSVIAQFTNSLRGELTLDDGMLKGAVASTMNDVGGRMKEMEERFRAGMENGMQVSLDGKDLTLKDDHSVFLYLRLLVPGDIAGEYVLKNLNGTPVESDGQITLLLSHDSSADGIDVFGKVSKLCVADADVRRYHARVHEGGCCTIREWKTTYLGENVAQCFRPRQRSNVSHNQRGRESGRSTMTRSTGCALRWCLALAQHRDVRCRSCTGALVQVLPFAAERVA
ncbi:protein of unknown function DUF306 [Trypanosoma melophagium]|uniref:protein of unknown function DUF306 n=1 Tax=Trypanosoma melophagium TaxID=715481 RepID=UPI003519FCBF|nr:protein of unknown function DUF306 [Trypanosoma melophagium]